MLTVIDGDSPLTWAASGRDGTEVSAIPTGEAVLFYDAIGPVARFDSTDEVRWWNFVHMGTSGEKRLRLTRVRAGDIFHYLVPGEATKFTCQGDAHGACEQGQCAVMRDEALAYVKG